MSQLTDEIKQTKPFTSRNEEVWVNLSRTTAIVGHEVEQRLRPYGLSPTQYNVLRILRGAGADGLVQHEVGSRLVAQVPDVPRILSRLEKAGLIRRVRGTEDRRVVGQQLGRDDEAGAPGSVRRDGRTRDGAAMHLAGGGTGREDEPVGSVTRRRPTKGSL